MDQNNNRSSGIYSSENFDDFVLSVAEQIFAHALGKKVAEVLAHNFRIREPSLGHASDSGSENKIQILQRLLSESFGEFHNKIMLIVIEEVCVLVGLEPHADTDDTVVMLSKARKAFGAKRATETALS